MAPRYDDLGNALPFSVTSTPGTGELYASAHDVARFAMFHLKDHLADQQPILTPQQIDELHHPVIRLLADRSYGVGWMIGHAFDGTTVLYHNGNQAGVVTVMMLLPSRDISCVVLANQDDNQELVERIRDGAIRTLVPEWTWKSLSPPPPERLPETYHDNWQGRLHDGDKVVPLTLSISEGESTLCIQGQKPEPISDLGLVEGMMQGKTRGDLGLPATRAAKAIGLSLCAYNYEVRSWRARSGQKHQSLTRENQTIFLFGRSFLGLMLTIPTSDFHFSKQLPPPLFACYWLLIAASLSLSSLLHVTHTSKVVTILSRSNSQCPLENVAHRIDIPKAALSSNCF